MSGLMEEMLQAAGEGLRHVVFDLSGVSMMSSMGLGFCIASRNEAVRRGADCVLLGVGDELLDLLRLMKLDPLFRICGTESELARLTSP